MLFPLAKQTLTEEDDSSLLKAFVLLDQRFSPTFLEEHLELLRTMRMGILRASLP